MKVIVLGATGTVGKAVSDALATRHTVVRASRKGETRVDVNDLASIEGLLDAVGSVDAVVNCAGDPAGAFGPLDKLGDEAFQVVQRWMMGPFNLIRVGIKRLRDGGSITLTTGALSTHPRPGSAAATMAGAGLEGLVRAAALEMPRGVRINAVSPGWIKETMEKLGMDSTPGMSTKTLAGFYVSAVEGKMNGKIIDPTA